ncbi:MAG: hypothetical protein P8011_16115 [Acidihalobacter sp.]
MSWHHAGYGAWHHGYAGGIGHMIVSSIVHGVVYDVIWKAMRGLDLAGSAVAAVVVIALVWAVTWLLQAGRR